MAGWLHIHPLFFLLAFSAILTGAILDFILLFTIVLIHEMGHFWTARYYNWRVEKLEIWLFGGAVVSEEHHTRPFKEQTAVVLAGPLQHVWIYLLLSGIQMWIGPHPFIATAFFYNTLLLGFNLMPVWPLDGGKLIFYLFCQTSSFQKSLKRTLLFLRLFWRQPPAGCSLNSDGRSQPSCLRLFSLQNMFWNGRNGIQPHALSSLLRLPEQRRYENGIQARVSGHADYGCCETRPSQPEGEVYIETGAPLLYSR